MKKVLIQGLMASAFLAPLAMTEEAEAREYCREYTKTIRVNGHRESGYGTACQQADGSWMIIDARGNVDPFDTLRRQNVEIVAQDEPVYYDYGPYYRPVTYYAPVRYRSYNPGYFFSFGNYGGWNHRGWNHDNDRRDHDWNDNNHHGRH